MFTVDSEKCIGCGKCVSDCFPKDIDLKDNKAIINNIKCISCGHCIAICPQNAVSSEPFNMSQIIEYDAEKFDISSDNLMNFIKYRRTIRQYTNKNVEQEKILKIIEAGRYTQTSSNMQDVSYIVVKDNLDELKSLILTSLNALGEKILNSKNEQSELIKKYANMWIDMYNNPEADRLFYNAPVAIIITATSPLNGSLAASNMELMTNALDLGTLFSGFFVRGALGNDEVKAFLGLEDGKEIVTCMLIGYPKNTYERTVPRKEANIKWK